MLDRIIKYVLYLSVFIFPLWFLPLTAFPVALNKQMFLSGFVFLLLILWLIKTINAGKLSFAWNKLCLSVLCLISVVGLSTIFSSSRIQSFWGSSLESDTFFSFLLYGLVFFIFSNLVEKKKEILKIILIFLTSSAFLGLLFLIQSFVKIFPWDFANSAGFNPIGSVRSLGVFLGGSFVLLISGFVNKVQVSKNKLVSIVLPIIFGILFLLPILIINYWPIWLGIAFAMSLILFQMLKNVNYLGQEQLKEFVLPIVIFVFSVMFIFVNFPTNKIVEIPMEIKPSYELSFDISTNTLGESPKNFVLGSGPATFAYQYRLYRGQDINVGDFWQIEFTQGTAVMPTLLTTNGILGFLAMLSLVLIFLIKGFKRKLTNTLVFVSAFYFLILLFFYTMNFSLMFALFLMLGLNVAYNKEENKDVKEIVFSETSGKGIITTIALVSLIAGSIFTVYVVSQKYVAALNYSQGVELLNSEEFEIDKGIMKLEKAISIDPIDTYFRNISSVYLVKINRVLNDVELSQDQKIEEAQKYVFNTENSVLEAIKINPRNSQNWMQLGLAYENLFSIGVQGTDQLAISSYKKAQELDPLNPMIPLNLGQVYSSSVRAIEIQITALQNDPEADQDYILDLQKELNKTMNLVVLSFQQAIELKPNFDAAYYVLAQIYEEKGEINKALENYEILLILQPGNKDIQNKIQELENK